MSFVGLDPDRAGDLARHLEEAATDLKAHADRVAALLGQAGISSSHAPAEIRDVAAWAAYRARDLRKRIDRIVAADHVGAGPRIPGFRFATPHDAHGAAAAAATKLRALLAKGDAKAARAELDSIAPYVADQRFAAELFKRLGPKGTFDLVSALPGDAAVLIIGRALSAAQKSGVIPSRFVERMVEAAIKRDAALDAYVHPWGSVDARDRLKVALDDWQQSTVGPPALHKFMEAVAPLIPYLEAGAQVAVIGGAVVILTAAGACVALSEGSCLGPTAAFVEEGIVVFSSEAPSVPTGLFETLPMGIADEGEFIRLAGVVHGGLNATPYANTAVGIQGSAATGLSFSGGVEFDVGRVSDYDVALAGDDIFAAAQNLGVDLRSMGTRTGPLTDSQVASLGLGDLRAELSQFLGRDVHFMIYRSIDDVVARRPTIEVPRP